jgi:hypothetical protein
LHAQLAGKRCCLAPGLLSKLGGLSLGLLRAGLPQRFGFSLNPRLQGQHALLGAAADLGQKRFKVA